MSNENRFELIELFDYYQTLLTQKQCDYFTAYYFDDFSLAEIAETFQVSRAAVHDALNKITKELVNYEQKLHLHTKAQKRKALIEKVSDSDLKVAFLELEQ
ncbi:YlxM family DNA-binding protein [Ureaplasma ceti]|uniref:UPF0122 protein UREOM_4980 n=1 Tax=Ureaplasma ceti TaxID=3119530 RepID=A0ABP9U751_9BACT